MVVRTIPFLAICLVTIFFLIQCTQNKQKFSEWISRSGSDAFNTTIQNSAHEIQIIYGEIIGDSIVHHHFNTDKERYFYPASTVKMPVAFAAIKKAQELNIPLTSKLIIDSTAIYPRRITADLLFNENITIYNQIQKVFAVSDNTAYNILFGWLGKDYINNLYKKGNIDTRIVHQLGENAFSFRPRSNEFSRDAMILTAKDTLYFQEEKQSFKTEILLKEQQKGIGYIDSLGNLVSQPFNFSEKNFVPLEGLLHTLEAAVRPDLYQKVNPYEFNLKNQKLLDSAMNLLPQNLPHPYDTLDDNYVKFLMFGDGETKIPPSIKIRNKVGWAYGYLTDVAYIEDTRNGIEFFLAAVVHVNRNAIYNDGVYEYENIGLPFLDELGDIVYEYELSKLELESN